MTAVLLTLPARPLSKLTATELEDERDYVARMNEKLTAAINCGETMKEFLADALRAAEGVRDAAMTRMLRELSGDLARDLELLNFNRASARYFQSTIEREMRGKK